MKTDLTYLRNMSGGSDDIIKEMVGIFVDQVKEISDGMHAALNHNEWVALSKLAHKAKSSVAVMGMNDLSAELKKLESIASEGIETNSYTEIVNKFDSDCTIALNELKEYQ